MTTRWELSGFDIGGLIGSGATGQVWRARRLFDGRPVALKRLVAVDAGTREQLRRDAALLDSLVGPHVIAVHDVVAMDRDVVLVLALADGGSLAALLARRMTPLSDNGGFSAVEGSESAMVRSLTAPEVVTIAGPLGQTLATAHRRGLVHGAVTPGNVLFGADGRPMLSDFGLLQALDPAVEPAAADDVFGLAGVARAALCGRASWPPEGVPAALVEAVEHGLAADPHDRPDAETFAAAVLRSCAAAPVRLLGASGPTPAAAATLPATVAPPDSLPGSPSAPLDALVPSAAVAPLDSLIPPVDSLGLEPGPPPRVSARGLSWYRPSLLESIRRRVPAAAAATALLALAVVVGLAWGKHGGAAAPAPAAATGDTADTAAIDKSPGAPSAATADGRWTGRSAVTPTSTPAPPTAARAGSPPIDWRQVVVGLDRTRTAAFATRDLALLRSVYAPDSPDGAADVAALRQLVAAGAHVRGMHARVLELRLLSAHPGRARLRVVDSLSSYVVVDRSGRVVSRAAARPPTALTMTLLRVGAGWRVEAVRRAQ